MSAAGQHRAARNEHLFREANEAIEKGLWPGEARGPVRFRCECAQLECQEVVRLALLEYEQVRRDGRQFIVLPGHELPETEDIVDRREGYLVVRKKGEAALAAERLDPR